MLSRCSGRSSVRSAASRTCCHGPERSAVECPPLNMSHSALSCPIRSLAASDASLRSISVARASACGHCLATRLLPRSPAMRDTSTRERISPASSCSLLSGSAVCTDVSTSAVTWDDRTSRVVAPAWLCHSSQRTVRGGSAAGDSAAHRSTTPAPHDCARTAQRTRSRQGRATRRLLQRRSASPRRRGHHRASADVRASGRSGRALLEGSVGPTALATASPSVVQSRQGQRQYHRVSTTASVQVGHAHADFAEVLPTQV